MEGKMNKIGALWLKQSSKGTKYFSGTLTAPSAEKSQIVIFKVKEKKSEKSPDYEIFLSEPRQTAAAKVEDQFSGAPQNTDDSDIPF
jgi:uncharacterized protein (DUF736 family)